MSCPFRLMKDSLTGSFRSLDKCSNCGYEIIHGWYIASIRCRLQPICHLFKEDYDECVGEDICPIVMR